MLEINNNNKICAFLIKDLPIKMTTSIWKKKNYQKERDSQIVVKIVNLR